MDAPPHSPAAAAPKKKRRRRRPAKAPEGALPGIEESPDRRQAGAPKQAPRHTADRPRRDPPDVTSVAAEAIAVLDRLVTLVTKELGVPPGQEGELTLPVPLPLDRRADGGPMSVRSMPADQRVAALVADLRERVSAATASALAFQEGHVYCFLANAPESPYSRPPHRSDVFAGYAATGKPEWISFANLCLARREPRVDRLYGDTAEVLAFVQGPGELDTGLLPSFGRGSLVYKMLGQVVLGFVPVDFDPRSRAERIALSLQLVETSQPGLRHRLRLNVIGMPLEAIAQAAADQPESSPAEAFRKVLRATRARVDALGRRAALAHRGGEAFDLGPHVSALLTRLRQDVLRVLKSRDYRTHHAQVRHESGDRPTALAIADALAAGEGRFFRDEHKDTIVVLGPRHRVHVFTRAARHVTSLELQPAEVERRLDLRRWRYLEKVGSELFKDVLRKSLNPDELPG